MSIRQPGMERKERNFYGEAKLKGQKKPGLLIKRQRQFIELEQIESQNLGQLRVAGCEINDRYQHEQAAGHGIDHEFNRRIDPARSAPPAQQKKTGNQQYFPKPVKKKKIQ